MITTIWRKHWLELRGILMFNAVFALLPAIGFARSAENHVGPIAPVVLEFIYLFAFFALAMFPVRFAGTGLATSQGVRPPRGTDPSLLFTLSLPVRRRTLFFYRTGFCLLAIEGLALLGLGVGALVFAHAGGAAKILADGLPILLLMVPLYLVDSLLSIRFDAVAITQVQIWGAAALWFGSSLVGIHAQQIAVALSRITPGTFVLGTLLLTAGLAILTIWRIDRHDY